MRSKIVIISLFACLLITAGGHAADDQELLAAFQNMYRPSLDTTQVYQVSDLLLTHQDFTLTLDSGTMYLCKPITGGSGQLYWGGFFEGQGSILFKPPVQMEKDQLRKFFDSDSLNREIKQAQLIFGREFHEQLTNSAQRVVIDVREKTKRAAKALRDYHQYLVRDEKRYYIFQALKAIAHPVDRPFLLVNTHLKDGGQTVYQYDPYAREEVSLFRHFWEPGLGHRMLELVCSYSQYIDPTYISINGIDKTQLETGHYQTQTVIDKKGNSWSEVQMTLSVVKPTQMATMSLHREMTVDSILDAAGHRVSFLRWEDDDHKSSGLYLIFNQVLSIGDTLNLTFHYEGEIADFEYGEYIVNTAANCFPRYGFNQPATFDMTFKTPKEAGFVAVGKLQSRKTVKDTLVTHWRVDHPVAYVSFNMGFFEKHEFIEDQTPPVEIYFSETFHKLLARYLSANAMPVGDKMQEQVALDIMNCLRIYSHYFGPYLQPKMVVSEILQSGGVAFPGYLHLGYQTFVTTDSWGSEHLFRAHEVAHQWWGIGIDYQTYHDRWLAEGFAEYSALMYVQVVDGNDLFMDKLDEYRDDIYSARKYWFWSGEESGPIALGHRTSSSKTRGDVDLIIYKKAAWVLHMLRNMLLDLTSMNEDQFLAMMRDWYSSGKGRRLTTAEFKLMTEKYTGIDMTWFFDQYVYSHQLPTYEFSYQMNKQEDGQFVAVCHVEQRDVPAGWIDYIPIEIEFNDGRKAYLRLLIEQPVSDLQLPPIGGIVKKIRFNPFNSVIAKIKQ